MKKLYISCKKEKKMYYTQKLYTVMITPVQITENIRESDMIFCIGRVDQKMKEEISFAKELNIDVVRLDENLSAQTLMNEILENRWDSTHKREYTDDKNYEL
ncbi:hypothetical protein [Dorea longicatena]|uniref:hypothetical protein n=1 Tax=Dorea longicatena TaxID=88431 RepID=UPI001570AC5D|nr:hypothetical protein [Dorea longicatena]NSD68957.1 hypothetical protein [Dorea longicatena]